MTGGAETGNITAVVKSPARLHLGIIDLSGALSRKYGSIGVAIDEPFVELRAERSANISVVWQRDVEFSSAEIIGYAKRVIKHFRISGGVKIEVGSSIPRHVGLGSTTQMALSIAAAVTKLYGVKASARDLSALLGLGRVSGSGTAAFEFGGFTIDGGVGIRGGPPPVLLRVDFPEDWFFVVAVPSNRKGMSGVEEKKVFEKISVHQNIAREISHLILMKMVPALVEKDIKEFGAALTKIQKLVGKSFSLYQEGFFHSKVSKAIVHYLLKNGAYGSGQSSWGPAVYGVVKGREHGEWLKGKVESYMNGKGIKGRVFCTSANNRGAFVRKIVKR